VVETSNPLLKAQRNTDQIPASYSSLEYKLSLGELKDTYK
jgi:hypothetical protein